MNEGEISAAIVYELLQQLRVDVKEQHVRLRTDMNDGFNRLTSVENGRLDECKRHLERLAVVETQIREWKLASQLRMSVMIACISSVVFLAWQFIARGLGWDR